MADCKISAQAADCVNPAPHRFPDSLEAREFFEIGKSFAFSRIAFNHVRYQAKIYGGEFERSCLDLEDRFREFEASVCSDLARLRRDLLSIDLDLHGLQSRVVSIFLVSRSAGYDVAG